VSLEAKALRGVPWTMLAYGANKLITVGTTVILARLLVPADFGLFALALLATNGLSMFNDLGLGGTLVLRQDLDRRAQGTVLTVMMGTAATLAVLLAACAPLAARAFGEPRLEEILLALSPLVLLGGVNWFHEALLQRELEFRRRFLALTAQSVAYAMTAISLGALADAGVWSLVGGQLAGTLAYGAVLLLVVPYHVRPAFDPDVVRLAVRTGSGFLVQRTCAFLQENADYLAVGRVLGPTSLGFYSMAYRLGELPYWAIADPVAKVTFPGFARMRERGEDLRPTFLTTLRTVALVACPLSLALSAAADPFTRVILGDSWLPMIPVLSILGIWGVLRPVQVTLGWLLNSAGAAGLMGAISVATLVVLVPVLFVAADRGGIDAVAWVMVADMVLSSVLLTLAIRSRVQLAPAKVLRAVAPLVPALVLGWCAGRATASAVGPDLVALVLSGAATLSVYAAALLIFAPGLLPAALRQARATLGR
jgi:PST family polysaccharide transporter